MKKILESNKGITIVALVITIIILLILATVTIKTINGEGILKFAQKTRTNYNDKQIEYDLKSIFVKWQSNEGIDKNETLENAIKNQEYEWCTDVTTNSEGTVKVSANNGKTYEILSDGNINIKEDKKLVDYGLTEENIGDYVNYPLEKITLTSDSTIIKNLATYSGITNGNYNTEAQIQQESLKWRILDIKDGQIRIISDTPTQNTAVRFSKWYGYNNAVYLLDELCRDLYSTQYGTAQNIKIEDIQDHINYDYKSYINTSLSTQKYGETKEYTTKVFYPLILGQEKIAVVNGVKGERLGGSNQSELITQTAHKRSTQNVIVTQTAWDTMSFKDSDFKSTKYAEMLKKSSGACWLSSRCININSDLTSFGIYQYLANNYGGVYFYTTGGGTREGGSNIRPIVTLNSNVNLTWDKTIQMWNINIK